MHGSAIVFAGRSVGRQVQSAQVTLNHLANLSSMHTGIDNSRYVIPGPDYMHVTNAGEPRGHAHNDICSGPLAGSTPSMPVAGN